MELKLSDIQVMLAQVSPDTEDAIELQTMLRFSQFGWRVIRAIDEVDGDLTLLGREDQEQVALTMYLVLALKKINSELPDEAIEQAVQTIIRDRSTMPIIKANQDVYNLIKKGVPVSFRDGDGNIQEEKVWMVDWNYPNNNDFLLVSQLWVNGFPY